MALDPHEILQGGKAAEDAVGPAPLAGTRSQRMQRLQIGLLGLGATVLVIGLANIIISTAQQNQAAMPENLPPATAQDVPPPDGATGPRDPLADAGVAPDLPVDPAAAAPGAGGADTPPSPGTGLPADGLPTN